jgi:hypothetical protein
MSTMTTHPIDYTIEPQVRLYRTRPGIVTGLGVACILVAALSGVASGILGVYGFGTLWFVRMITGYASSSVYGATGAPMPPRLHGAPPPGMSAAAPAAPLAPAGIASPEVRREIIRAVDAHHRLASSRQSQLDKLLAEVGLVVGFALRPEGTPLNVRRDLVEAGKTPATQPGEREMDYLTTRAGRIELSESSASFTSTDGSVGYRTSVGVPGFGPVGSSWTLAPAEVQQVMTQVQTQSQAQRQQLNPAQLQALQDALQSPAQRLVQPGMAQMMWTQVTVDPNGVATITFSNKAIVIAKQGVVVSVGPAPLPIALQEASLGAAALVVFENGMSLALAIFLLVTGILLLRQSSIAVRLLKLYAWAKLPLAIVGGIGVAQLWGSFSGGMMTTATDSDRALATGWGIGLAIAGLAFPLAILAMLAAPGVKQYFSENRRVE